MTAVDRIKRRGANNLRFLCLLAAPEGIKRFQEAHPDVPIYTAAIDEKLNEKGLYRAWFGATQATVCTAPARNKTWGAVAPLFCLQGQPQLNQVFRNCSAFKVHGFHADMLGSHHIWIAVINKQAAGRIKL